jgi:hypothetical protein
MYSGKIAVPPGGGGIVVFIFLSETFFPYFFHVHLNILDKVVSSLYAIFGTPVCIPTVCLRIGETTLVKDKKFSI